MLSFHHAPGMRHLLQIVGLLLLGLSAHAQAYVGNIKALKVVSLQYPPFQYEVDGKPYGVTVDIVKEAFMRLHIPINIKFQPFPRALSNIKVGSADVIFTFYHKKDRERFAYYSKSPLIEQTISLFARKDRKVKYEGSLDELNPYTFGMVRYSYGKVLDSAVREHKITKIEYVSETELNFKKFVRGRFDILPSDRLVAYYYLKKLKPDWRKEIRELTPAIQTFPAYVGFSKAAKMEQIRDKFDWALQTMKEDGTYQKIIIKHLNILKPAS
ncbi:substrate-binding periplasmic protein [Dongshaea marina]|uniref:substrate-binding periplasmic protein n=1 Tax=Dongshaea marina TaxID=2047966 RepID=UPI000D3EDCCE|nr:transporter substrate-binding domain-containing protein [Dongshaea marina]